MLEIRYQTRFKRDVRLLAKRGYDLSQLEAAIGLLQAEQPLPQRYRDHPLSGPWSHYRECHIEPDWLLVYKIDGQELVLILARTGTHSDILSI